MTIDGCTGDRQRYRLRQGVPFTGPDWLRPDGVYEGDLCACCQAAPAEFVRLSSPDDLDVTYLVPSEALEEVA